MPTFHLVVDEVVPVDKFQFRVRMWRQAGFPPLVLFSQVPGHPPPDWYSSVSRQPRAQELPGLSPARSPCSSSSATGMQQTRAFRVRYETIGCDLRPILRKPKSHASETLSRRAALRSQARHSTQGVPMA